MIHVSVREDKVIIIAPAPMPCAKCKRAAYFFVNKGGETTCSPCADD